MKKISESHKDYLDLEEPIGVQKIYMSRFYRKSKRNFPWYHLFTYNFHNTYQRINAYAHTILILFSLGILFALIVWIILSVIGIKILYTALISLIAFIITLLIMIYTNIYIPNMKRFIGLLLIIGVSSIFLALSGIFIAPDQSVDIMIFLLASISFLIIWSLLVLRRPFLGVGLLHIFGLFILVDLDSPDYDKKFLIKDINMFISSWDDGIADNFNLRIKNIEEVRNQFYKRVIENFIQFNKEIQTKLLNQDFFIDLKKCSKVLESFQKVDKQIKNFLQIKIEYISDSLALRIRRKIRVSGIGSIFFGSISAITSLISIILVL
ncbi:MAG: hypothetical protein ACFFDL_17705 [Promethearchaeota archaeon]